MAWVWCHVMLQTAMAVTWPCFIFCAHMYFFDNFQVIFIVFDHANACASMPLLVEIHNNCILLIMTGYKRPWEYVKCILCEIKIQKDYSITLPEKLILLYLYLYIIGFMSDTTKRQRNNIRGEEQCFTDRILIKERNYYTLGHFERH